MFSDSDEDEESSKKEAVDKVKKTVSKVSQYLWWGSVSYFMFTV